MLQTDPRNSIIMPEFVIILQSFFHDVKKYHVTPPIVSMPYTFVVTRGLPYTPMEKLILPFDIPTWILVVLFTLIAYLVIFIVTQFTIETQQFVFGRSVLYPYFNVLRIFLGVGLSRIPGRNFARFFMIAFTLYCLVIRTAYQGKMFQQMTGSVRKPTPTTVSEMLQSNYTILAALKETIQPNE